MTTEDWAAFSTAQMGALTAAQAPFIPRRGIEVFNSAQFNALGTAQFGAFTSSQLGAITSAQTDTMTTEDLAALAGGPSRA